MEYEEVLGVQYYSNIDRQLHTHGSGPQKWIGRESECAKSVVL